jgi:hypothetical protein
MSVVRCSRCGRVLRHPIYVDGKPYGSTCVKKIGVSLGRHSAEKISSKHKQNNQSDLSVWIDVMVGKENEQ